MNNENLESSAKKIADLIAKTGTDDRGVLLSHVATLLRGRAQNYTAILIYKAAVEYGFPQNSEPDMPKAQFTGRRSRSRWNEELEA